MYHALVMRLKNKRTQYLQCGKFWQVWHIFFLILQNPDVNLSIIPSPSWKQVGHGTLYRHAALFGLHRNYDIKEVRHHRCFTGFDIPCAFKRVFFSDMNIWFNIIVFWELMNSNRIQYLKFKESDLKINSKIDKDFIRNIRKCKFPFF